MLEQIRKCSVPALEKVIVTINAPALDAGYLNKTEIDFPFELCIVKNENPIGFGANHNRAFTQCRSDYYFVMNPDLDIIQNSFSNLLKTLEDINIGCAYPTQCSGEGLLLDFERELATPSSIIKRHIPYIQSKSPITVDAHWVSGSFMAFSTTIFRELGGFDESYFMYCEDVDICLRLQLAGYRLAHSDTTVVHHTQRKTLKNLRHLAWHIRSLFRLWNSNVYKEYKRKFFKP